MSKTNYTTYVEYEALFISCQDGERGKLQMDPMQWGLGIKSHFLQGPTSCGVASEGAIANAAPMGSRLWASRR